MSALGETMRLEGLRKENARAWAEVDRLKAATQWQPIETAPKDGTVVFVCGHGSKGYYVADAKWMDGWWMFDPLTDGYDLESFGHTHWMPLPAAPEHIGRHRA